MPPFIIFCRHWKGCHWWGHAWLLASGLGLSAVFPMGWRPNTACGCEMCIGSFTKTCLKFFYAKNIQNHSGTPKNTLHIGHIHSYFNRPLKSWAKEVFYQRTNSSEHFQFRFSESSPNFALFPLLSFNGDDFDDVCRAKKVGRGRPNI